MKVVALFSGGLDSILAVRLLESKRLDVNGIFILTSFNERDLERANKGADYLKIPLKVHKAGEGYINLVISPKYGYGKNMNPCVDCKIYMYRTAKNYCEEIGAEFIITGEVLGERPMSQNRGVLLHMEKEAECTGLILRPLSAKLLPPTVAERSGVIDRKILCNISGRSRKPHIELANLLQLKIIPTPAGGCLLTDPVFSGRLKESIEHDEILPTSLELLSIGRHFRLSNDEKLIVSRNSRERKRLIRYTTEAQTVLESAETLGILFGKKDVKLAAAIVSRYSPVKKVYYRTDTDKGWVEPEEISRLSVSNYRL